VIGPAAHFDEAARAATGRQWHRLRAIRRTVEDLMPVGLPRSAFLCSGQPTPAGETFGSHGVVFLAESLLSDAPAQIVDAVAVHEAVHLLIGRDLRDSVEARNPEPYKLLHEYLIRDWMSGRIQFQCDRNYIEHKGWRILYDGWLGPLSVENEKAADAVIAYFDALRRGHVSLGVDGVFALPTRAYETMPDAWDGPLAHEYEKAPAEVVVMAATGFELVHYFRECLESATTDQSALNLWLVEEGFANFVSTSLTGLALDEIQRWAPQDRIKVELARRIGQPGVSVEDVLQNTASIQGMAEYARRLGIAGPSR
jgi:hypothetical protein